jgi:ribosome-binding factor A
MPREFSRTRRLEEAIQRILSQALGAKARDPRLAGVTITEVNVSKDLGLARVYYTMLSGDPVTAELERALVTAAGFLRSTLAGELHVRNIPELRFPDEALEGRALLIRPPSSNRSDPRRGSSRQRPR